MTSRSCGSSTTGWQPRPRCSSARGRSTWVALLEWPQWVAWVASWFPLFSLVWRGFRVSTISLLIKELPKVSIVSTSEGKPSDPLGQPFSTLLFPILRDHATTSGQTVKMGLSEHVCSLCPPLGFTQLAWQVEFCQIANGATDGCLVENCMF